MVQKVSIGNLIYQLYLWTWLQHESTLMLIHRRTVVLDDAKKRLMNDYDLTVTDLRPDNFQHRTPKARVDAAVHHVRSKLSDEDSRKQC